MKMFLITLFILVLTGLLITVVRYLLKEHRKMYGACWIAIIDATEELFNRTKNSPVMEDRHKEIKNSTKIVKRFTDNYDGLIDLDIPFTVVNPDWEYFRLLRVAIRNEYGFIFPIYMDFLERAIFHYNNDKDYIITTRQLIEHSCRIFDTYYAKPFKEYTK